MRPLKRETAAFGGRMGVRNAGNRRRHGHGADHRGQPIASRLDLTNDPVLVNRQRQGNHPHLEQVERVHQDRPVHLLPLHEQSCPVGVLLLDDPQHLDLACLLPGCRRVVPPGHVNPAACSPGSEDVQDQLVTAKVSDAAPIAFKVGQG